MTILRITLIILLAICVHSAQGQTNEKIIFDKNDSTEGYYLAITPESKQIKGVILLLTSFYPPETLLTETKLHSVASTNDLLTVVAPMKQKLYADSFAVDRINRLIKDVQRRYTPDSSRFALAGFGEAGNIALRYTELSHQFPTQFPVQPKAVFGIDTPVDLFGLWRWSESQIKKNYWPGAVGDAKFYIDIMTQENGTIYNNAERYKQLTPFWKDADSTGNEQYLKTVAVRLYYDTDIEWHLSNRRNSLYDTKLPDGSELINRLLLAGNDEAEFVASKKPGVKNDGSRHPATISIVDEVACIQWIKRSLNIFDAHTWIPPYTLSTPPGWGVERFALPPDFAPAMTYKGIEDIRFAPGWGDSTKLDYWSYAFLWWLEGAPQIDAAGLQRNLQLYYAGLVNRNVIGRKIPENRVVPTEAAIKKVKTVSGDLQTFSGSIRMLDYMTQRPMILNTVIHVKDCKTSNRVAVFIELSPRPVKHNIWEQMEKIANSFSCKQ